MSNVDPEFDCPEPDQDFGVATIADFMRDVPAYAAARDAVGNFLIEFSSFEGGHLIEAIATLSKDPQLVCYIADLMDLSDKLKLFKELGSRAKLPESPARRLRYICKEADSLLRQRNIVAHNVATIQNFVFDENSPINRIGGIALPARKLKPHPGKFSTPE